jgi:class 3 adenylate cyclase
MIRFALEALRVIKETNVKLGATLAVRIGINTLGPIIAGVLGTDKPVFDGVKCSDQHRSKGSEHVCGGKSSDL